MVRSAPTARLRAARLLRLAFALLGLVTTASCGASIQAVYEGDVRFEHCMALDARPDVEHAMREICWGEWITFYTYGQTRDRIEYARLRQRQIAAGIRPGQEAPAQTAPTSTPAVPDPTSALVPPPMMLATDGGPADTGADATDATDDRSPPAAECAADCAQTFRSCEQECKTAPCEKTCAAKYKRCMRRCF